MLHKISAWICVTSALLLLATPVAAQDGRDALEEELFGAEETEEAMPEREPAPESADSDREAALFGEEPDEGDAESSNTRQDPFERDTSSRGSSSDDIAQKLLDADERLAIGGFMLMQPTLRIVDGGALEDHVLSSANLVDLYLDARPSERVRLYVRGRLLYDYTVPDESVASVGGLDLSTGTLGGAGGVFGAVPQTRTQLDQLWLKFDVGRVAYITLGRQRIRWGSGRFWNPTDFLNTAQINPIAIFDARLGVDLLKVHVPIESLGWNLYAIGMLGGARGLDELGGALRAEIVVGPAELALSAQLQRQRFAGPQPIEPFYTPKLQWPNETTPLRLGADLSSALGPLDVKVEAALTRGLGQAFYRGRLSFDQAPFNVELPEDFTRQDEWVAQAVMGFEWLIGYGDDDTLAISAEYFYNGAGYDSSELYLWTLLQGGFRPLYMGRHYAAAGIALPSPGSWNDTTLILSTLGNLSDKSFLSRFDYRVRVLDALTVGAFVSAQYGENGELFLTLEIPGLPGDERLGDGLRIPATRWTLGASFQLSF